MKIKKKSVIRKKEILEAAMKLFSNQGFRNTTMDDIASAISLARTTLYDYYKSKDEILYALIDEVVIEQREMVPEGSLRTQLEVAATEIITRILDHKELYKILFQEMPSLAKPTADKINAWQQYSMIVVQKVIKAGITEEEFHPIWREEDITFAFKALVGNG